MDGLCMQALYLFHEHLHRLSPVYGTSSILSGEFTDR
jgi:hypothetical protein